MAYHHSALGRATLLTAVLILIANAGSAQSTPIKIGVSTALTGDGAPMGLDIRDAVTFANEKLGGERYQLIIEDDKCDPKEAVSLAHKFIEIDKVKYVIGFTCSSTLLATAPLYERNKVLAMGVCGSSPKVAQAGDFIFRTIPSDAIAAQKLYDFVSRKNYTRFGVISALSDYPQDIKEAFASHAGKSKLKIISEDYAVNTADFRTLLLKLKASKVDGLFINSQFEADYASIIKQVLQMQWKVPLFGAYYPASPVLLDTISSELEGVEFVDTPALDEILNKRGHELFDEFTKKFGKLRSVESIFAAGFEGFRAIDAAIQSGEDARKYLYASSFEGIFGPYTFDQNGEIRGFAHRIKKIVKGKVVVLE